MNKMLLTKKQLNNSMTFLLGFIFIFSGVVKGIDPFGTSLKIDEYFNLFHLSILSGYSDIFSVFLCAMEIFLGLMLVFSIFKKTSMIVLLIIMSVFTVITAIIAFDPYSYIQDCGCFGDAVHLSEKGTFFKNVLILLVVVYCCFLEFSKKDIQTFSIKKRNFLFVIYFLGGALALPLYSKLYLPPMDFLGYNIGENLLAKKSFNIADENGTFIKDSLFQDSNYQFVVINRRSFTSREKQNLIRVKYYSKQHRIDYMTLNSYQNSINNNLFNMPHYFVDDITLKSIIRDNNGLLLLDGGVIKGKWNLRHKIINDNQNTNLLNLIKKQRMKLPIYLIIILIYLIIPSAIAIQYRIKRNKYG